MDQAAYSIRGNALWSRATHEERSGVLTALKSNRVIRELDLWNSLVNDAHAATIRIRSPWVSASSRRSGLSSLT